MRRPACSRLWRSSAFSWAASSRPGFDGFGPLHHFGGLVADESPSGRSPALRVPFLVFSTASDHPAVRRAACSNRLISFFSCSFSGQFPLVLAVLVLLPGGVVPPLHFNIRPVDGQHMVHTPIQESPVVGDQDKPLLPRQVLPHLLPGEGVQVVGGFIDQKESVLFKKRAASRVLVCSPLLKVENGRYNTPSSTSNRESSR